MRRIRDTPLPAPCEGDRWWQGSGENWKRQPGRRLDRHYKQIWRIYGVDEEDEGGRHSVLRGSVAPGIARRKGRKNRLDGGEVVPLGACGRGVPGQGTKVVTADIVDRPLSNGQGVSFTGSQVEALKEAGSEVHVMFASYGTDCAIVLAQDVFACAPREEL